MTPEQRRRVDEVFDATADLSAEEQERALEAACGDDAEVKQAVLELLRADAAGHPVLDRNVAAFAGDLLGMPRQDVSIPGRVDNYIIRECLGQGGMGTVYLAEREGLGDRVAIKFLRHAWSSPGERRRFASEQRTLASLNHRYIARLYDAGVFEDTQWFAMELVRGVPLTEHCKDRPLRQRLQLFRAACEAVSYAHRMLIVHRDLKPSNILVNSEGEVKLVDFGIAKQLDGGHDGGQTIGPAPLSLNYAAPEQIRGEAVSMLSDVYALGVVLYELLTGSPPADLNGASAIELARWLEQEADPPSRLASVTATAAGWKDLDLLCLTACRKQPDRRYRSVDHLIRDIDHFLKDEPLEIHPESLRYRALKFCSRNRRAVTAAALAVTAIAAMAWFFTWRLVSARDQALTSQARTERIHRMMLNLFEGDDEAAGPAESLRVVTLLDRGALGIAHLNAEPAAQMDLQSTLGDLYHKLGRVDRAEPLLRAAFERRVALLGANHPDAIRSQISLALFLLDRDRTDEAEQLAKDALAKAKQQSSGNSALLAGAILGLGKVASARGSYDQAVPLLEEAVRLYSTGPPAAELSEALTDLANTDYYLGRMEECEALNRRLLPMDRQLFGEAHPHVAVDLFNLGNIALDRAQYAQAEQLFRAALRINEAWYTVHHPKSASNLLMLGRTVDYLGRTREAADFYRQALDIYTAVYSANHLRVGQVLNHQGSLSMKLEQLDQAEEQFARAAAIFKQAVGEKHEFYAQQLSNLGEVYRKKGQYIRAEQFLQEALARLVPSVPQHRFTGVAQTRMAGALIGQKRYRDAEPFALAGFQTLDRQKATAPVELQEARQVLAVIYTALRQPEKLEPYRIRAGTR